MSWYSQISPWIERITCWREFHNSNENWLFQMNVRSTTFSDVLARSVFAFPQCDDFWRENGEEIKIEFEWCWREKEWCPRRKVNASVSSAVVKPTLKFSEPCQLFQGCSAPISQWGVAHFNPHPSIRPKYPNQFLSEETQIGNKYVGTTRENSEKIIRRRPSCSSTEMIYRPVNDDRISEITRTSGTEKSNVEMAVKDVIFFFFFIVLHGAIETGSN
jgi:hypothetical protein